ncbi:MAG: ASKHA domain-containing protein [Dissulfuribacterales bacterium]
MASDNRGKHLIVFQPSGVRCYVNEGKTIKEASRELGVDIEGVCFNAGTCGTCRVKISEGFFEKYGMESSNSHLSPLTDAEEKSLSLSMVNKGYRLACQAQILGDVVVFIPEESRMNQQVVRKAARKLNIEVNPAVRKYFVKLRKATLEDAFGDWERLEAALGKQYGLSGLSVDYHVLSGLQKMVRKKDWEVTVSIWKGQEVIRVEPGFVERCYGLAVDIGTTTVAGYLCDLETGEVLVTESIMNPQVMYGEDVMSRITYTMVSRDGLKLMNQVIIKGLNELFGRAAAQARIKRGDIVDIVLVGNTCMHHILLKCGVTYVGRAPFTPALHGSKDIKARDLGLKIAQGAYAHVLPVVAGFVGADNVGVLIAEEPYKQDSRVLIIDIGTNGELIMGNRQMLISCSCATGPAFEGAEIKHGMRAAPGAIEKIKIDPAGKEVYFKVLGNDSWNTEQADIKVKGICGSAIIDAVLQMFRSGIIDRTGRFEKDLDTDRLRLNGKSPEFVIASAPETSIGHEITICQEDVRNVQLAKAALYAGAKIMMRKLGMESLDKIILAGAFGSYIDKESAARLGIFPDCELENIYAVGNAAGDGARMALLNTDKRAEANDMARQVEYVELTSEPDFEKIFIEAIWIPHMKDAFPRLEASLTGPSSMGNDGKK